MCPGQIPGPERGVRCHDHTLGNGIDKALPKMDVVERASCLWSLLRPSISKQSLSIDDGAGCMDNLKLHAEFLRSLTDWKLLPGRQHCEAKWGCSWAVVVLISVQ